MKAAVSAKFAEGRTAFDAEAFLVFDDAAGPAGDLGDKIGAEAMQDLIERALHRGQ
jgi:hypothetical protein